jgi:hypothetical protein
MDIGKAINIQSPNAMDSAKGKVIRVFRLPGFLLI